MAPPGVGNLLQRDLELVERLVAGLVDARRLAGGADELAGEQVGKRGMVLPVGDDAAEQIGPPQERAVRRREAAEHDVVAAAGADMPAVELELLGAQPDGGGLLVDGAGDVDGVVPGRCRMHVDLDHAGVGRDLDDAEARVERRRDSLPGGRLGLAGGAAASIAVTSTA